MEDTCKKRDFAVKLHKNQCVSLEKITKNQVFVCNFSNWHGICMYISKEIRQRKAEKKIEGGTFYG